MKENAYTVSSDLVLGKKINDRVLKRDQTRQRLEAEQILLRLRHQPGVILADEVGMGKTFVALAIAYSTAVRNTDGPVVVMVPPNLIDKWEQDLGTFCELYLDNRRPVRCQASNAIEMAASNSVRYGIARHSVQLMRLLDDPPPRRCHVILLAQGAMSRSQTDKWVRLALIAEALRRHGRGRATQLIAVKRQIHRFIAELLWARGEERAHLLGDGLWKKLVKSRPSKWRQIYNSQLRDTKRTLEDDPVPEHVLSVLDQVKLRPLAEALKHMPIRSTERLSRRLADVRTALKEVEGALWKDLLTRTRWNSPLLIMDEAHHLKNPRTSLARQFRLPDSERDLRTGDGAMARAFDRMLFLTATPFQLGHHELVRVLERFLDVRWDLQQFGDRDKFRESLKTLSKHLDESQRAAVSLRRQWSRLRPDDVVKNEKMWWTRQRSSPFDELTSRQRAVVDGLEKALVCRQAAERALRPWIVRHNKGAYWSETTIKRRRRIDGAAIVGHDGNVGLAVPSNQQLPFFLAARSAVIPGKDLLGEAICSSYEAFRNTRRNHKPEIDEHPDEIHQSDLTNSTWYLREFDTALERYTGNIHPKVAATVQKAVDLWEIGEKVLVFAFYRRTCSALRSHISSEIERRTKALAQQRLLKIGSEIPRSDIDRVLRRIQKRYFDDRTSLARRSLDRELDSILDKRRMDLVQCAVQETDLVRIVDVMRRFLRVSTNLVRCFPIDEYHTLDPETAVGRMLDNEDGSNVTWRKKFEDFVDFLTDRCTTAERADYLDAVAGTRTGGIRVETEQVADGGGEGKEYMVALANVQVATGTTNRVTRSRLMRAFNTPFFPDILVCSQVMGEGVDLQRFCRHVIHHDIAWNPSSIEQRTGRVDRLGCKAEGRENISVYLPYLAGAADERQYRVMTERDRWFRVVMGQDEVARLISPESDGEVPLPDSIADELSFNLELDL